MHTPPANRLVFGTAPLLALLLSACASSTPQQPPAHASIPAAFKQAAVAIPSASVPAPGGRWWTLYGDAQLDALVERATLNNTSIQLAASRLAHARAAARQTDAPRRPQLDVSAGVSRQQGPLLNAAGEEGTLFTAAASLSYEVDLMGRLSGATDAATLDQQARQDLLDGARLLVQAQVVQNYLALRALDDDTALLEQALAADREALRIQAHRLQSGSLSEMDFERLRSDSTVRAAELPPLQQRRAELEHGLALLLGQAPADFQLERAASGASKSWRGAVPQPSPGLPAAVLARRPDVAAAQKQVLAAQKRLGLAQSVWLPSLTLTGTGGYASPDLGTLFGAAMQTWVFGALAALPVFDGGRREAGVAMAEADYQSAVLDYRASLLQALREVEDQLAATRHLAQQADAYQRARDSATRAGELAAARLRNGSISSLEALQAQDNARRSQRQLQQLRASQLQTSVALVRAIGGGWE